MITRADERGNLGWMVGCCCFAILAVYLGLALFTYPGTDDWCFYDLARTRGMWGGAVDHWKHWGGRFTGMLAVLALTSLPCWWISFPAYILANLIAIRLVIGRLLTTAGVPAGTAALIWVIFMATVPVPSQGLYWMCGSLGYVATCSLAAVLVALADTSVWPRLGEAWRAMALAMGGLFLSGCGETATIAAVISWSAVWILGRRQIAWAIMACVVGMIIATQAPGNAIRLASSGAPGLAGHEATTQGLIVACLVMIPASAGPAMRTLGDWLLTPVMGWLGLALAVFAARQGTRASLWTPMVAIAAMVAIACLVPIPSLVGLGMIEGRQMATMWYGIFAWFMVAAWSVGSARPQWCSGRVLRVLGFGMTAWTIGAIAWRTDQHGLVALIVSVFSGAIVVVVFWLWCRSHLHEQTMLGLVTLATLAGHARWTAASGPGGHGSDPQRPLPACLPMAPRCRG